MVHQKVLAYVDIVKILGGSIHIVKEMHKLRYWVIRKLELMF